MPEINQPTPIKPIWPARREESPNRRKRQPESDDGEKPHDDPESQSEHKHPHPGGERRIDEYV